MIGYTIKWNIHIRGGEHVNIPFLKGVLKLITLAILTERDQYGYSLAKRISNKIERSEGSLYPLLRR